MDKFSLKCGRSAEGGSPQIPPDTRIRSIIILHRPWSLGKFRAAPREWSAQTTKMIATIQHDCMIWHPKSATRKHPLKR